ncbi:MAG TPA: alpha/beta hydrolase [Blastocatellia bacterium]|nr:alpha/beta hydrolase [Blastocatellia bacterium]
MILISCRKDFTNSRKFSAQNFIRNYPFLPKLDQFEELDEMNLAQQMQGKHVLILVHGFRNPLTNVASSYQRLLKGLIDAGLMSDTGYGLVLGFTWPGFETPLGFFPAIPFANRSAGFFRSLLELASRNARTVDVQTHSLGARVVLQALAAGTDGFVDNLMLAAPAVDNEVLEPKREFNNALEACRRCLVYHSEKDSVLKRSYRIGDAPEFDKALGWKGPQRPAIIEAQCPEVFVVDCKKVVASHGAYRTSGAYYEHWGRVLHDIPLPRFELLEG